MSDEDESGSSVVGRSDVLDALYRQFDDLRTGSGAVTLVVGDTGVGKSTLISQLVRHMRSASVRVMVGRAPAMDDPPPFSLLQSAIDSAQDDPLLRSDADPLLGGNPTLLGFIPGLDRLDYQTPIGIEARLLGLLGSTAGNEARSRDEFLTEIADRFLELIRHGPTVLVLEDLHHADPSSLAAIGFFAQELGNRPLWILATARTPASLHSAGRNRLETFEKTTRAGRVVVRPLTSDEAAEYLKRIHPAPDLSPEEIERRFSEAGGNPYLLQQLDQREIGGPDEERAEESKTRVDEPGRQILEIASVIGPEFRFSQLFTVSDMEEEHLAEALDRLVGQGLVLGLPGEVYKFLEERQREQFYNLLAEPRRRALHRQIGEALESEGSANATQVYALAHHFYLGRVAAKSVRYNRLAAEFAERALAPETAWEHYMRAIESQRQLRPEDLEGEAELVLALSRVMEGLGVLRESEDVLRDFLDRTEGDTRLSAGRRATLEVFLCEVLASQGNLAATAELAQRILSTPDIESEPLIQVGALHHLGLIRYYEAKYREALDHHNREIELARRVGNAPIVARARIWRASDLQMIGQVAEAIAEARAVTVERDRFGSVKESAMAHIDLADVLSDARSPPADRADAIGEYSTAIGYAEQAKDPRRIGWALYKTVELLCDEGRFVEAAEKAQRACQILQQVGDRVGLGNAMKARGRVAMGQGDLERADSDLSTARQLLEGTNNSLEEADSILRLAQLARAKEDWDRLRAYVAELQERNLARVRPDLGRVLEQLQGELATRESGSPTDPP